MRKNIFFIIILFLNFIYINAGMEKNDATKMLLFIKPLLSENPSILEAGGHYGEDTVRIKSVYPNSTIHVFEPLSSSFTKLIESTMNFKNVICYQLALSEFSGMTNFYVYNEKFDGASSINKPKLEISGNTFEQKPIQVPCITIDDWAEKNKIDKIDFMWLDLEGHELSVLQKSLKTLKTVQVIWTEINFVEIRDGSCKYFELKNFLESQGFKEFGKIQENLIQANALFIRTDLNEWIKYV